MPVVGRMCCCGTDSRCCWWCGVVGWSMGWRTKQVGTFTDLLSKLEKESKAWDKRARCTQEEVDELRQGKSTQTMRGRTRGGEATTAGQPVTAAASCRHGSVLSFPYRALLPSGVPS